jgi:hypothetical protein
MHEDRAVGAAAGRPADPRFRGNRSVYRRGAAGGKRQCVSGFCWRPSRLRCCPRASMAEGSAREISTTTSCRSAGHRHGARWKATTGQSAMRSGAGVRLHAPRSLAAIRGWLAKLLPTGPAPALARADRGDGRHHGIVGTRVAPVAQAWGLQRAVVGGLLRPVAAGLRAGRAPRPPAPSRPGGAAARPRHRGGVPRGQPGARARHADRHLPRGPRAGGAPVPDAGLEPRVCGDDVVRDCTLEEALFSPMR